MNSSTISAPLTRLATILLGLAIVPFLGLLALALPRFHTGLGTDQIVTFYVVPFLVVVGLAVVIRSRPAVRVAVALLLCSLGGAALAGEVVAGFILGGSESRSEPAGTERSLADRVMDLRAAGLDAYPNVSGNIVVNSSPELVAAGTSFYPVSPSRASSVIAMCTETVEDVVYRSDRFGFNNPDSVWDAGHADLLLVGDSYTQGLCISAEGQITAFLPPQWTTVNLGWMGAGGLLELATMREYGADFRAPAVVWIYYEGNDRYDLSREVERAWLTAYLDPDHRQGLRALYPAADIAYAEWIEALVTDRPGSTPSASGRFSPRDAVTLSRLRQLSGFGVIFPSRTSAIGRLPDVLERARLDVEGWGGTLYLGYMPAYQRYRALVGEGVPGKRELLEAANELGIEVIDFDAAFRAHRRPRSLWAHPRGHLSAEGNRIVAEEIAEAVRERVRR